MTVQLTAIAFSLWTGSIHHVKKTDSVMEQIQISW
jgi:hypothetical protein